MPEYKTISEAPESSAGDDFHVLWTVKKSFDLLYRDSKGLHLIDLKSTGTKDRTTFLRDCERYEYGRQAAFYLDGTGAKSVTIYGVQKRGAYGVFRKRYTKRELEDGRRMYGFILGKVAEGEGFNPRLQISQFHRPSSKSTALSQSG